MDKNKISFDNLPQAVAHLVNELETIKSLVEKTQRPQVKEPRVPIGIDEACKLIGKAKPTVYTLVRKRILPSYKNGKKLYFSKNGDIWMIERTLEGWSEPKILPSPINSDYQDDSYTETKDGDVYISSKRPEGFGGIDNWRINRLPDQSLQAENLGPIMNSTYFDYSPFIAPDGSYLIFGSYRGGADGLLYISFKKGNDEGTTPINMNSCGAKVNNTTAHHSNPSLSPDGKYLFFRRHANMMEMDVYWVSTSIIDSLRNKAELAIH